MNRTISNFALTLLVCAAAQAATIPTTLTVNATVTINSTFTAYGLTGTANFTGGIGNGTIASSLSLTSITGANVVADYTITVAAGGTLTGKLSIPYSVLSGSTGSSVSASLTVT